MTSLATCLNSKIPKQFISNNRGGQAYIDAIFATTLPLEVFVKYKAIAPFTFSLVILSVI